jgi:hypothetical protein
VEEAAQAVVAQRTNAQAPTARRQRMEASAATWRRQRRGDGGAAQPPRHNAEDEPTAVVPEQAAGTPWP